MSGETFADLLAPNLKSVRRFVETRMKAPDHAEDILQQTLLRAFERREQLRVPSKFKSWLCSIAVNEIRMSFRGRRPVPLEEASAIELRYRGPSPHQACEQNERQEWLHSAMAQLSERDRAAIRLRDIDCLSLAETAEALHSSEGAAKSLHFRARQRLAGVLRENPGLQPPDAV